MIRNSSQIIFFNMWQLKKWRLKLLKPLDSHLWKLHAVFQGSQWWSTEFSFWDRGRRNCIYVIVNVSLKKLRCYYKRFRKEVPKSTSSVTAYFKRHICKGKKYYIHIFLKKQSFTHPDHFICFVILILLLGKVLALQNSSSGRFSITAEDNEGEKHSSQFFSSKCDEIVQDLGVQRDLVTNRKCILLPVYIGNVSYFLKNPYERHYEGLLYYKVSLQTINENWV